MKQIYLGLILLSTMFISCDGDSNKRTTTSQDVAYKNDALGFSMNYPENFEAVENINQYIPVGFFEKIKDSTTDFYRENLMLNVEDLPVEVPFDDYVQAGKTQLKLMMKDESIKIFEEDSILVDGHKAATYKFYIQKDSVDFLSKFYVIPLKKKAYQFNCTSNSATFPGYEAIFDKMVESVKFN